MTQSTTENDKKTNQKAFRVTFQIYGKTMATTVYGESIKTPEDAENHVKSKLKIISTDQVKLPDIQKDIDAVKESLADAEKKLHDVTETLSDAADKMFGKIDSALDKGFRKVDSIFDSMSDMWKSSTIFYSTKETKEDATGDKTNPKDKEDSSKS